MADIFGKASALQLGLVDAESQEKFNTSFQLLEDIWNSRESDATGYPPVFHKWFADYCSSVVLNSILRPVTIAAGLGSPPPPYYTNAVESLNRVTKLHTGHKKQQLPQFVEMMEELYNTQEREVAKALSGSGEYRVISTLKKHQY